MNITELLMQALNFDISDVHLSALEPPLIRVNGKIERMDIPSLSSEKLKEMLYTFLSDSQRKHLEENLDLDFALELNENTRFRVNIFHNNRGLAGVFRKIPNQIPTIADLQLPPILAELTRMEKGLILVTGPTGSGKSTTIATMLNKINEERSGHILTIEDPIEFVHKSKSCLVNQREVGENTKSFSRALRSALREDPDFILVGEMRDLETIQLALTAAETGHLVFATLHTSSAINTIDRIIDVFPAGQQGQVRAMLAESIQAVIAQTLCQKQSGGRVPAFEILIGTSAVRNLIREAKIHQIPTIMQTSQQIGMQTLEASLGKLLSNGLISQDTYSLKLGRKRGI